MKLPVAPNRELGQHFLVDENILGVAGRLADLQRDDVVLEVGAGLGVLTAYLAERVRLVHAVELDRGLEPHLRERLAGHDNVELVLGDALTLSLAALDPPPGKLVANLPYQIATPLIAESRLSCLIGLCTRAAYPAPCDVPACVASLHGESKISRVPTRAGWRCIARAIIATSISAISSSASTM